MDNQREHLIEAAPPATPEEPELLAVIEQSERETAEGMTVPLATVLAELEEFACEIEARLPAR